MVWSGISLTGKTRLGIGGNFNAEMRLWNQRNISTDWDQTLCSKTHSHRAGFFRHYLQNLGVERMEQSTCSSCRTVYARVTNTSPMAEEWDAISQQCVTKVMTSMRRRYYAVVAMHGSSTCWDLLLLNEYIFKLPICLISSDFNYPIQ